MRSVGSRANNKVNVPRVNFVYGFHAGNYTILFRRRNIHCKDHTVTFVDKYFEQRKRRFCICEEDIFSKDLSLKKNSNCSLFFNAFNQNVVQQFLQKLKFTSGI